MPRLIALCAALLAAAAPAWAGEFVPGGNGGTLARGFALPAPGQAQVVPRGRSETRLTFDVTNEYVARGACADECILLDGETSRLRLAHRRGLGGGWEFGIEVPLLDRGGGFLDGWIQDWHGWFGLPNGGREFSASGQYRYYYERDGVVLLDETRGGSGVGDVELTLGRAIGAGRVLRAMAKLPTGDEDALGGGNAGGALWLEQALPLPRNWNGYLALGGSYNERGEVLPDMQNHEVAFGGIGLLMPVTRTVRLSAQLYAHSRLYDGSELTPLARIAAPLTLGLQFRTGRRGSVEVGFQEDPSVDGSPDFSAYLSLRVL
jgi:hypothetical protein